MFSSPFFSYGGWFVPNPTMNLSMDGKCWSRLYDRLREMFWAQVLALLSSGKRLWDSQIIIRHEEMFRFQECLPVLPAKQPQAIPIEK